MAHVSYFIFPKIFSFCFLLCSEVYLGLFQILQIWSYSNLSKFCCKTKPIGFKTENKKSPRGPNRPKPESGLRPSWPRARRGTLPPRWATDRWPPPIKHRHPLAWVRLGQDDSFDCPMHRPRQNPSPSCKQRPPIKGPQPPLSPRTHVIKRDAPRPPWLRPHPADTAGF
jgi:hypothetical protein